MCHSGDLTHSLVIFNDRMLWSSTWIIQFPRNKVDFLRRLQTVLCSSTGLDLMSCDWCGFVLVEFIAATTLTGLHFSMTTLMTLVLRCMGYIQPSHLPLLDLVKFALCANFSIVGMNVSLMWNSVGFYQVNLLDLAAIFLSVSRSWKIGPFTSQVQGCWRVQNLPIPQHREDVHKDKWDRREGPREDESFCVVELSFLLASFSTGFLVDEVFPLNLSQANHAGFSLFQQFKWTTEAAIAWNAWCKVQTWQSQVFHNPKVHSQFFSSITATVSYLWLNAVGWDAAVFEIIVFMSFCWNCADCQAEHDTSVMLFWGGVW